MRQAVLLFLTEQISKNEYWQRYERSPGDMLDAALLCYEYKRDEHDDGWNPNLNDAIEERFGSDHFRGKDDELFMWITVGGSVLSTMVRSMRGK